MKLISHNGNCWVISPCPYLDPWAFCCTSSLWPPEQGRDRVILVENWHLPGSVSHSQYVNIHTQSKEKCLGFTHFKSLTFFMPTSYYKCKRRQNFRQFQKDTVNHCLINFLVHSWPETPTVICLQWWCNCFVHKLPQKCDIYIYHYSIIIRARKFW